MSASACSAKLQSWFEGYAVGDETVADKRVGAKTVDQNGSDIKGSGQLGRLIKGSNFILKYYIF